MQITLSMKMPMAASTMNASTKGLHMHIALQRDILDTLGWRSLVNEVGKVSVLVSAGCVILKIKCSAILFQSSLRGFLWGCFIQDVVCDVLFANKEHSTTKGDIAMAPRKV